MTNRQKFCLFQDNDGHWYMCQFERKDEAMKIIESIENYWEEGDFESECPQKPEWIQEIDGPYRLSFENPVEE